MEDSEVDQLKRALAAAEQRADAAEERADAAEELTKRTSFAEFIRLCHKHLTVPLRVEIDQSLTTGGSITNPREKKHPTYIRPWEDFPQTHLHYFDAAYSVLCRHDERSLFSPRVALEEEGRNVCDRSLTSEKDLEYYDRSAVEEKVKMVLRQLVSLEDARTLVNGCTEVEFSNHLNALRQAPQDEAERTRASAVDQACIFRHADGDRSLLLVREYKAAHKLSSAYLRAGLRPMAVRAEVVQRATIPNDTEEKLQYHADRLVAAAVTQTFEYMIDNGLEYGSFTTGLAEVYLRVLKDDPETVYYYMTEPQLDVTPGDPAGFQYPFTAISRLLGFCLMALHSPVRPQQWRRRASEQLYLWKEDFDEILRQIPEDELHQSPNGSLYSSPHYPIDPRSPYLTRRRKLILENDNQPSAPSFASDSSSEDPGDATSTLPESPTRAATTKRKRESIESASPHGPARPATSGQRRSFCTMKCLAGLRHQLTLDPACPNYAQHRMSPDTSVHEIDLNTLADRVQRQLDADADLGCDPLGIQGARGVLFRITLASHRYTFVAKGTVDGYRPHLRHEGRIYQHLFPLQGSTIPVYLGNIDLRYPYLYDVGVKIVHMLLISWGGRSLYERSPAISSSQLEREKYRSIRAVSQLSVVHKDWRLPNMLWNDEVQRVLVIDFERAHIRQRTRKRGCNSDSAIMHPKSPKRRRHQYFPNRQPLHMPESISTCT